MQVRCPQCLKPQTLDLRLSAGDTKRVECSECSAVFSVRAKAAAASSSDTLDDAGTQKEAEIPTPTTPNWQVRKPDGTVLQFPNLSLFQTWQAQGIISIEDEISRNGHQWRKITDIPELVGLFDKEVADHPVQSAQTAPAPPPLPNEVETAEASPTEAVPEPKVEETEAPSADKAPADTQAQEAENPFPEADEASPSSEDAPAPAPEDAVDAPKDAESEASAADPVTNPPPPMTFEASAAELLLKPGLPSETTEAPPVIKPEEVPQQQEESSDSNASDLSEILKQAQELPIAQSPGNKRQSRGSRMLTVALILMLVATVVTSAVIIWQRNMDPPEQEGQIFGDETLGQDTLAGENKEESATASSTDPSTDKIAEAPAEKATTPTVKNKPKTDTTSEKSASVEEPKEIIEKKDPVVPEPPPKEKVVAAKSKPADLEIMPDDEPEEPMADTAEVLPSDPETYNGLMAASKVALKRNPSRALVYARKAMERNPRSVRPITRMGWAYLRMGDTTNAIIQFDRARNMNPGHRDTYRGLGQSYERANRTADAIAAYERYLAMCGNCSRAKKIINRLDSLQR